MSNNNFNFLLRKGFFEPKNASQTTHQQHVQVEKAYMYIIWEFASIFIHEVGGRKKKDVSCLKEFTLVIEYELGEGDMGPALG